MAGLSFCSLLLSMGVVLSGCHGAVVGSAGYRTVVPLDHLVQTACDGPGDPLTCAGGHHRQTVGEAAKYRRYDLPPGVGSQIGDCTLADGVAAAVCQFSYPPHGAMAAANGDGGDLIVVEGRTARIKLTQDGGKPGVQHFVGPECGGEGWVLFRDDAPSGRWASMVATLGNTADGSCPKGLSSALTRWRVELVPWTLYEGTSPQQVNQPTIVSEHYDAASVGSAKALERFYFVNGFGKMRWSAWRKGTTLAGDLAARCPAVQYDEAPDQSGWYLADCRTWTVLAPQEPGWTAAMFDWPPP